MELTKEQIQQIDNYISVCGIKYYDVKAEIIDHFASILEVRLDEEPNLDFKKAIVEEHRKFSDKGFQRLLNSKSNLVHKNFLRITLKHLKSFFKLPKLVITIGLFYLLKQLMDTFQNKEDFFGILSLVGVFIMAQLTVRILIEIQQKKEQFLVLNKNTIFVQIVNFIFIFSNTVKNIRSDKSFLNEEANLLHIAFFVLLLLFYWSGEYVFYKNKMEVKKQYPNVFV